MTTVLTATLVPLLATPVASRSRSSLSRRACSASLWPVISNAPPCMPTTLPAASQSTAPRRITHPVVPSGRRNSTSTPCPCCAVSTTC